MSAAWLALAAAAAGAAGEPKGLGLSQQAAQIVLVAVTGAGAFFWLLAVWGLARLTRAGVGETEEVDPDGTRRMVQTSTQVIRGTPGDIADGLVRALAAPGPGAALMLVKRDGDELLAAVPAGRPRLGSMPCFSRCEVRLAPSGLSTDVTCRLDFTQVRRRAILVAGVILGLGLLALVALPLLLWTLALSSEIPGTRAQVAQAIHVGHLLWPPWLVYALYRRGRRSTSMYLDASVANASAMAEAFAARRARKEAGE